ncbi:PREDICTED: disintegrin and metalloproteinase domain-containing protein 8 [Chrysochloris asiatica]|uniref:Disintegrin and metalloproteinase domain-containing protein 8 n=1 Tax=Chrysochloris asiatica TaxID=185453 RepID=A0A9B0TV70_CHRAS|nr:PREDICTED: disintegrin and metalloproteinase domain-containing protein 8 [Chrysochloris asiatica]
MALGPPLPHVERFQVVWPQRLPTPRARRALPSHWSQYPDSVSYILSHGGHNFTLHLRKNRELLSSRYTETYTAANGSEVVEQLGGQDHCLYQGHVEGQQGSAASLSTCDGLRGFFQAGSAVHLIEPLKGEEEGPHALYLPQHLKQKRGTCGVSNERLERILGPRVAAAFRPRNRPVIPEPRHVELYVVTDSIEFQKFKSRETLRARVLEVVNHVDKLYQELGLRVGLVGLDMWSSDKILISSNAEVTLKSFQAWRTRELVGQHSHDNAQLITGIDFDGTTVGLASLASMCSQRTSAGVNQDHSQSPLGVASTIAHEMGHNLAMDHDENIDTCYCAVPPSSGGCVMAASLSFELPKKFSQCSRSVYESFVETPQTECLRGMLNPNLLVSDPVCGNKLLERGEQCDCGSAQECQNPCCNATTCKLTKGAACAQGACCDQCQVKPAGHSCRSPKDACDLEEYCDGQRSECPEDVFQENGSPCSGGYCYDGACPTLDERCSKLWGSGAQVAVDTCYTYSLTMSCQGQNHPKGGVDLCSTLYCQGGQKPQERGSCVMKPSGARCQALLTEDATAYERVPTGTKCDEGKVCWKGSCQDLQVYRSDNCSAKCYGHGVCNHKNKCHCQPGWSPPNCAKAASSDVQTASGGVSTEVLVGVALLLLAVVFLLGGFIFYRRHKRNATTKTAMGLENPVFHKGSSGALGKSSAVAPKASPSQAPRPSASMVTPKQPPPLVNSMSPVGLRPATTASQPVPVPVYTRHQELEQVSRNARPWEAKFGWLVSGPIWEVLIGEAQAGPSYQTPPGAEASAGTIPQSWAYLCLSLRAGWNRSLLRNPASRHSGFVISGPPQPCGKCLKGPGGGTACLPRGGHLARLLPAIGQEEPGAFSCRAWHGFQLATSLSIRCGYPRVFLWESAQRKTQAALEQSQELGERYSRDGHRTAPPTKPSAGGPSPFQATRPTTGPPAPPAKPGAGKLKPAPTQDYANLLTSTTPILAQTGLAALGKQILQSGPRPAEPLATSTAQNPPSACVTVPLSEMGPC